MPTERAIYELVTVANMAGIDQVKTGFLGLNAQTVLLAAGLGIVYAVGKAGVENFNKQEHATGQLTQAYATQKDTLAAHKAEIESFLGVNKKFIGDQYDTQDALANLIRAGFSTKDALEILGAALDRTGVKGGDVTDSQLKILQAMMGSKKGIKELGISNDEYDKIMNDKTLPTAEKQRRILKLIEDKYKDGRGAIDEVQQSQNDLTISWQNFTAKTGPAVTLTWRKLNEAMATGLDILSIFVDLQAKLAAIGPFGGSWVNPTTAATGATGGGSGRGKVPIFGGGPPVHMNITIKADPMNGQTADAVAKALLMHARYRPGT